MNFFSRIVSKIQYIFLVWCDGCVNRDNPTTRCRWVTTYPFRGRLSKPRSQHFVLTWKENQSVFLKRENWPITRWFFLFITRLQSSRYLEWRFFSLNITMVVIDWCHAGRVASKSKWTKQTFECKYISQHIIIVFKTLNEQTRGACILFASKIIRDSLSSV